MFNSPRPSQRYVGPNANGSLGGSFVDTNPLSSSVYDDGLDPWSSTPSPAPTPIPQAPASVFSAVIADATVPSIYHRAYGAVDPAGTGETSVTALSRVLGTSSLPATTIDKIVNLVSSRPRVSKLEFFVALALVALAQSGKVVSIEQVAALSSQNTLPEPTLDLSNLQPSSSILPSAAAAPRKSSPLAINAPVPAYSSDDPWNTNPRFTNIPGPAAFGDIVAPPLNGSTSTLGTGLPTEWWKKQENIKVVLLGQQGFILNRYTVYEVTSDRRGLSVTRRYSEFVSLWDVLLRRYPFRLFPALPPKRIGADDQFIEQRRRGLARALNFVVNHPTIKDDGVLASFLTEYSFETWRKQAIISLDEESVSKRVDRAEEMSVPSDLEDKIAIMRGRVGPLIDHWQRICILAERIIKRREAAAVRVPALRRIFVPTHLNLPNLTAPLSPSSHTSSLPDSSQSMIGSLSQSFLGLNHLPYNDHQGDLARLTNTLRAVIEISETCWRGDDCELSNGVRSGLAHVAAHTQRHSEIAEMRSRNLLDTTLESLKNQRDLYLATRDLFIRHDRLSIDQVERLKKRIETNSVKLDGVRAAQKENWQDEVERLTALIEKDQATIAAQLSRRIFIRACMWHELRVVLHNRENTLLSQAVQNFAHEEHEYSENVANNWESLVDAVEGMPLE